MFLYSDGIVAYLQDGAAKYIVANLAFLNFIQPDLPGFSSITSKIVLSTDHYGPLK
jgi:hypothetical protein